MTVLLIFVVAVVATITIWRPTHLYEQVNELKNAINNEGLHDMIEDAVIDLVQKECLKQSKEA